MRADRAKSPRVEIAVKVQGGAYAASVLRAAARRWVREDVSIALVSDRESRSLNRRWRGKDRPTDVLSFALHEPGALGEVVIWIDTAGRPARGGRWSLA